MFLGKARGSIRPEVGLKEVTPGIIVVQTTEIRHHRQLARVSRILLCRGITCIHVGKVVVGEVLTVHPVGQVLVTLGVPSKHSLEIVFGNRLVVVQKGVECSSVPIVMAYFQLVGVGSLVGVVLDKLLEVRVTLRSIDVSPLKCQL